MDGSRGKLERERRYFLIGTCQEDVIGIDQRFLAIEQTKLLFLNSLGHIGPMQGRFRNLGEASHQCWKLFPQAFGIRVGITVYSCQTAMGPPGSDGSTVPALKTVSELLSKL